MIKTSRRTFLSADYANTRTRRPFDRAAFLIILLTSAAFLFGDERATGLV